MMNLLVQLFIGIIFMRSFPILLALSYDIHQAFSILLECFERFTIILQHFLDGRDTLI